MLNTSIAILALNEIELQSVFTGADFKKFNSTLTDACQKLGACSFLLSNKDSSHTVALKLNKIYELRDVKWSQVRDVADEIYSALDVKPSLITELTERWGTSRGNDTYGYNTFSLTDSHDVITKRVLEVGGGYDMRSAGLGHWLELFLKSEAGAKHLEHLAQNVKKLVWSQAEANGSSQEHIILSQVPYALTMYQHRDALQNIYDSFDHKQKALSACADAVELFIKSKNFGIGRGYGVDAVELVASLAGLDIEAKGRLYPRKGYQTTHHNIYTLI